MCWYHTYIMHHACSVKMQSRLSSTKIDATKFIARAVYDGYLIRTYVLELGWDCFRSSLFQVQLASAVVEIMHNQFVPVYSVHPIPTEVARLP